MKHFIRFIVIGIICVAIDLSAYLFLLHCGLPTSTAKGIGYCSGMIFGFFGNKFWSFQSYSQKIGEPIGYVLLYGLTFILNIGVNALILMTCLNMEIKEYDSRLAAFICATAASTASNFLGLKYLVFRVKS